MTRPDHIPVLRDAVVHWLRPAPGRRLVDGTYGRGGHTAALLAAGAEVLALDLDPRAVAHCRERAADAPRLHCHRGSFRDLAAAVAAAGWRRVDGILLDLGVSSPQLDDPAYGFSYRFTAPLDLRFDPERGESAADLLRRLSAGEVASLLRRFGEVRGAVRIARAIAGRVAEGGVLTTTDVAEAVAAVVPPARRAAVSSQVFQALRIAVNDELSALAEALPAAVPLLVAGGRIAVIAYHSLEDRIVKRWLRDESRDCLCPPSVPVCRCGHTRRLVTLTRRPVRAAAAEIAHNPRARSARLRVGERLP